MAFSEIGDANGLIERELDSLLGNLEVHLEADGLAYKGPMLFGVDDVIKNTVETISGKREKLIVLLETTGGFIEPVQRIVDVFRRHYKVVDFIVPNYAMSAGTVLVMSGDSIYMDYYSVLGPIDPQVQNSSGKPVPGNGYLKQYDRLIQKSRDKAVGLSDAEMAFLIQRFDPAEMYQLEQAKNLSVTLLKDWLVKYKFKNWTVTETRSVQVTEKMKKDRAQKIADCLNDSDRWHSHGRGLSIEVARRELELKIEDFGADPDLNGKIHAYYRLLMDYSGKLGHAGLVHRRGRYMPINGE